MNEKLLDVKNLKINFGRKNAVKNINFHVNKNEIVSLVGESGSGKSVSALSIAELLNSGKTEGNIIFKNKNIKSLSKKEIQNLRGKEISYIFQEPLTSLNPLHKVGKQVGEIIKTKNKTSKSNLTKRIKELFELVQLPTNRLSAYPHELSGGQRQRVMIAMAIANSPELLIADEPTTALDLTVQSQIITLLKSIKEKLKISILFISHDLDLVDEISDRIYVMEKGEIVEKGSCNEIIRKPKNTYTKKLIEAYKFLKLKEKIKSSNQKILEVKNLSVSVKSKKLFSHNKTEILKNISFTLNKNSTLGIVGESGSGKSTLALAILRLIESDGEINYCTNNATVNLSTLSYKKLIQYKKEIQIVFQDPFSSLNPRMTIYDILSEGPLFHKTITQKNIKKETEKIIKNVGLKTSDLDKYPNEFSGGQRQRIAIAKALILKPKILILDEPTSSLDVTIQAQILKLLQKIQNDFNLTYIFISHNLKVIAHISDEVLVLKSGKIIEHNQTPKIFKNPAKEYTRNLINISI